MKTAAWVAVGTGSAALGAGGLMWYLACQRREAIVSDLDARRPVDNGDVDATRSYGAAATLLMGMGLAAVGTGVVLFLVAPEASPQTSLQMGLGLGQAALLGSF